MACSAVRRERFASRTLSSLRAPQWGWVARGRAFGNQELGELARDLVRAVMRGAASIHQPAPSLRLVPREPFVANASSHAVARAELARREAIAQDVAHELESFVHDNTLIPQHGRPRSIESRRAG
jgi:hypothetical protein